VWAEVRGRAQTITNLISSATVISVRGEIDAGNTDEVAAYVARRLSQGDKLVLDLNSVDVIAAQAYSSLHDIHRKCIERDIHWLLIPSAAVSRMLRIFADSATLPVAPITPEGLGALGLEDRSTRHLRLLYAKSEQLASEPLRL
jgi:anti-anti-sigma factor